MTAVTLDTSIIWYSASNEDTRSEIAALQPVGKTLLCITASGSRPFDLLLADPARIVAIDQNPAQTALAALLVAAYRTLDYGQFASFVGLQPAADRQAVLARLITALAPDAAQFWQRNARLIDGGLIYCGKWEGYLRLIQRLAGKRRQHMAQALLAAPATGDQVSLWTHKWDGPQWRWFLRLLAFRPLWIHILREPGMRLVPKDFDIGAYVRDRFDHAVRHHDLGALPFAWLLLHGSYPPHALPPYLSEAGFETIRTRLDRISFATASLQECLATAQAGSFDGASLSDYSSYCDVSVQRGVWAGLARAIKPGGRVCERKFFNKSGAFLPGEHGFVRDEPLEEVLFAGDGALFYSFIVAQRQTQ